MDSNLIKKLIITQNKFQETLGKTVSWGLLSLVFLSALIVLLRYGFDIGSIALQEAVLYNHAVVFMLGFAYTLQQNEHVRVDIFYNQMSETKKAWVDLLGAIFFALPVVIFIAWASWDYVALSWRIYETSAEAGGLEYVYLLKTVIMVMTVLMAMQILSLIASSYLKIRGR